MPSFNTNHDADSQAQLPATVFIAEVSQLIGKTETTIRTCATNEKYFHLIPRPFKLPNSRRLCWLKNDVLAWLNSSTQVMAAGEKKRGRPTKREAQRRAQINQS
jgi:predicted DNA-binding transcriptional regulator AlpA